MSSNLDETRTFKWIVDNIELANELGKRSIVINFADPDHGILSFHYTDYIIRYEYQGDILFRTDTPMRIE